MKNLDFKKLLVFILLIAIIVGGGYLVIKTLNDGKASKEEVKKAENISIDYYANLTAGHSTVYNGLDILYQSDKTTYSDIDKGAIINTAINYASKNEIDLSVDAYTMNLLKNKKTYGDVTKYSVYNAKGIREAAEILFGKDVFSDSSDTENYSFKYDYYYDLENDVYLVKRNTVPDTTKANQKMDYTTISTVNKDNKIVITVAIAYVYSNGKTGTYAKDKAGVEVIAEDVEKFPTDKVDEFDHFAFTMKKDENNKYVFESVEKVN